MLNIPLVFFAHIKHQLRENDRISVNVKYRFIILLGLTALYFKGAIYL